MFQARRLIVPIALAALIPAAATAYPIPPKPLWPLAEEADLIVVAEVTAVDPLPRDEDGPVSAVAELKVAETLKGPRLKSVEVPYAAGLLCPAPPRYEVGETVVAFLRRKDDLWLTVSLSYGTLYPKGDDMEDVITMTRAALSIQRSTAAAAEKEEQRLEWLVQATALPGTRWHGLRELAWDDGATEERDAKPRRAALGDPHRAILADAFVQASRIDYTLSMMLGLLADYEDLRIDEVALGVLEEKIALDPQPYWIRDLLWRMLERWGAAMPPAVLDELDLAPWELTPEHLREIWDDTKIELGIPDVTGAGLGAP